MQKQYLYGPATLDITIKLKELVEAGCTEREIADFARLRAKYNHIPDHYTDYPSYKFNKKELAGLTFYRWLYQNSPIFS